MKRAAWILLLSLFVFPRVHAQPVTELGDALNSGDVRIVALHGNGASSGPAVEGQIENLTEVEIRIAVNLEDPLYLGNLGAGQDMVAVGVFEFEGGYYVDDSERYIILMPAEVLDVQFLAYCADFDKENPAYSDGFVVSAIPPEIAAVAAKIARYESANPESDQTVASQLALWLSQGHAAEEIAGKFAFSADDERVAVDILALP